MRLLYVYERFGALGGAEANAHVTATEFGKLAGFRQGWAEAHPA